MLHSDTPLIVAIITKGCLIREKSYGKSPPPPPPPPPRFYRFSLRSNTNFHWIFLGVHICQYIGNYKMIAFYWYVLCIGILLSWHANDVMFWGCQANFGTQKNYATGTTYAFLRMLPLCLALIHVHIIIQRIECLHFQLKVMYVSHIEFWFIHPSDALWGLTNIETANKNKMGLSTDNKYIN